MNVRAAILVALFAAGVASAAPHATSFAEAQKLYDYQPRDAAIKAYIQTWTVFNNANHLDEKGNCWSKKGEPFVQILEIDATGKVAGYFADKDNDRSRCLRKAYFGVKFPAPPIAPFYHRLTMG